MRQYMVHMETIKIPSISLGVKQKYEHTTFTLEEVEGEANDICLVYTVKSECVCAMATAVNGVPSRKHYFQFQQVIPGYTR